VTASVGIVAVLALLIAILACAGVVAFCVTSLVLQRHMITSQPDSDSIT
jgi:hypothetical protein